jgi:hypothetical protein
MPYLPRLASGALCDCIALRWQFYLPVLSECEYERGNLRRDMKGESTLMDTDAADAIPQGRRQQRRGLVYDPSFTGCSPASWPHTCFPPAHGGMGGRRFLLGGYGEGVEDTIVDVAYSPSVDARMASFADDAIDAHVRKCRVDDPGTGGMHGMGAHMRRTGFVGDFAVRDGRGRQDVGACMELAGRAFTSHFSGRGVGFEGVLEEQRRLFPHAPPWPICWNACRRGCTSRPLARGLPPLASPCSRRASPPTHVTTHFRCPSTSRTRCMWIPGMGGVATPSGSLASATPALANPPIGGSSSPGMGSPLHLCTAPMSLGMGGCSTTAPRCPRWHRAIGCSPSSAPFLRIA